jgi:hypothetical protein
MSKSPPPRSAIPLYVMLVVLGVIGCVLMWSLPAGSVVAGLVYGKF